MEIRKDLKEIENELSRAVLIANKFITREIKRHLTKVKHLYKRA